MILPPEIGPGRMSAWTIWDTVSCSAARRDEVTTFPHLRPYLPENPEVLISHRLDGLLPLSLAVWSAVRARPEKAHEELFNPHRSGARRRGAGGRDDGDRADRSSTSASGQVSWRFATKKYRRRIVRRETPATRRRQSSVRKHVAQHDGVVVELISRRIDQREPTFEGDCAKLVQRVRMG